MRKEDFPEITIEKPGKYRLVDEETLDQLLGGAVAQVINIPAQTELSLGFLIRNYREAAGWTQGDLAHKISLHPQTIAKLEGDKLKTAPEQSTLRALAQEFGERFEKALVLIGIQVRKAA